jgi:hypothetical protein
VQVTDDRDNSATLPKFMDCDRNQIWCFERSVFDE